MILETERLRLEEAGLDDGAFFFELLNSPTWIRFIGDREIASIDAAVNYIQKSLIQSYRENGFGLYKMVLKQDDKPIGICGLLKRPHLEHVDIGFAILPKYKKKGYTFEAAKATMNHARSELGMETILGITSKENEYSKKLLAKIGLTLIDKIKFKEGEDESLLYSN